MRRRSRELTLTDDRPPGSRVGSGALLAALTIFGALVSLEFGRRGFMPLDQSIVFDGGWRVLTGQIPYRDFTTPSGLVPIVLQGWLFRLLGVSWFVYCLHAALVNAAFALLTYGVLRETGGSRPLSLVFAAASAVAFYPPAGVPFAEHHSFALGLVAVWLVVRAARLSSARGRALSWAAAAATLWLAALSKQIPAAYVAVVVLVVGLLSARGERIRFLSAFATGGGAAVVLTVLAGMAAGVDWGLVLYAVIDLPGSTAAERLGEIAWRRHLLGIPGRFPAAALVAVGLLVALVLAGLARRRGDPDAASQRLGRAVARTLPWQLLAAGLLATCVLFIAVTNNHPAMGLGYLFPALGVTTVAWQRALAPSAAGPRTRAAAWLGVAVMLLASVEAYRFHRAYNVTRVAHDFRRTPVTEDGARIDPAMDFLELALPEASRHPDYGRFRASHYADVIAFFRHNEGGFLLIGDSSILYALTGRPSPNPALWFHFGLTIPPPSTEDWSRYEARLIDNLRRYDCRYVVVERKGTWMGTHLVHFPRVQAMLVPGRASVFGPFQIVEIDVPA